MKKLNNYWAMVAILALVFTSCSKDQNELSEDSEKATLSFGTLLNDMVANRSALKQSVSDIPGCSDAAPAYVEIVLSGTSSVGSMEDPVIVEVNPNPGDFDNDGVDEYFTMESGDLELEPGNYSLDYFAVYDSSNNPIWIAPGEGTLSQFVDNPLPLDISLGAGVKKYVDVEVLCYDERLVNEYGYLFFDIETTETISLCVFGNFCDDNGRHSPAHFRVEVWTYSGNSNNPHGVPLFDSEEPYINTVGYNNDGDAYADPICVILPNGSGDDVYYGEVYLLDWGNPDDEGQLVVSGTFTDDQVLESYNGAANEYYHFRVDCEMGDTAPW